MCKNTCPSCATVINKVCFLKGIHCRDTAFRCDYFESSCKLFTMNMNAKRDINCNNPKEEIKPEPVKPQWTLCPDIDCDHKRLITFHRKDGNGYHINFCPQYHQFIKNEYTETKNGIFSGTKEVVFQGDTDSCTCWW